MKFKPAIHHRRSIRLQKYDYSLAGAYFVTICAQNRECLFGEIVDGEMRLNDAGRMIQIMWDELPARFANMELDGFVVMPNHIHGIIVLTGRGDPCDRPSCIRPSFTSNDPTLGGGDHKGNYGDHEGNNKGDHKDRPYGTLPDTVGRVVQAFKSITTHAYTNGVNQSGWPPFPGKLWQRNYWERIIRNEQELDRIREYIRNNPAEWESDRLYANGAREIREPPGE